MSCADLRQRQGSRGLPGRLRVPWMASELPGGAQGAVEPTAHPPAAALSGQSLWDLQVTRPPLPELLCCSHTCAYAHVPCTHMHTRVFIQAQRELQFNMCKRQHKHRSVRAAVPCCIRICGSTRFAKTVTSSHVLKVNDLYAHVHALGRGGGRAPYHRLWAGLAAAGMSGQLTGTGSPQW